jgi:hypothetical protein
MNSLYYFSLACSGWLSIILLLTSTMHALSDSTIITHDLDFIYNMPVITRSQSKVASVTEVLLMTSSTNLPDSLLSESTNTSTKISFTPTPLIPIECSPPVSNVSIMAQLSLPPWVEFYDSSKNDIISSTRNTKLNGKLYSKPLLALEGQALQSIVSRKHLCANGLQLLQELVQMYKPRNVPEVIAFKTS